MKSTLILLSLALVGSLSAAAPKPSCSAPVAALTKAIEAKPSELLKAVSASVAASPACACGLIKAAVEAAKADEDTTKQIVAAALAAAPSEAAAIKACLPAGGGGPTPPVDPNNPNPETGGPTLPDGAAGGMAGATSSLASSNPGSGAGGGAVDIIETIQQGDNGGGAVVSPSTKSRGRRR